MADRNPLLVTGKRAGFFGRLLGRGRDHGDPAEMQRMQAELERAARLANLTNRLRARRKPLGRLEAFAAVVEGEPGSNASRASAARRRALRRSQRRQPKHGRQYVVSR